MTAEGINRRKGGSAALAETVDIPLDRVKGTPVPINGEGVMVGKLSLNQLVAIIRHILAAAVNLTPEQRALLMQGGNTANLAIVLGVLDEKTVNKVFSIVLDKPEEWCGEHLEPLSALDIADAVLEHNDFEQLKAAFLRLRKRFEPSPKNSP